MCNACCVGRGAESRFLLQAVPQGAWGRLQALGPCFSIMGAPAAARASAPASPFWLWLPVQLLLSFADTIICGAGL